MCAFHGNPPTECTAWHYRMRFPWPLTDRDVCHVNCHGDVGDDDHPRLVVVESSVEHPAAPAGQAKLVRMTLKLVFALEDVYRPPLCTGHFPSFVCVIVDWTGQKGGLRREAG